MATYTQEQDELIDAFFGRFRKLHAKIECLSEEAELADAACINWPIVRTHLRDAAYTAKEIIDEIHGIDNYLGNGEKMAALALALKAKGV